MENQPPNTNSLPGEQNMLSRPEINALFVSNLSDVYNMKVHLASIIPIMVKKASYTELKKAILSTGLETDAQLLRMDFIFKYLKYDTHMRPQPLMGTLNIKEYLFGNIDNLSTYQSDYIMLTHLLMIEHIEVAQFRVLMTLAKGVYHKNIYSMIKLCLQEALKEKKTFELLSKVYTV